MGSVPHLTTKVLHGHPACISCSLPTAEYIAVQLVTKYTHMHAHIHTISTSHTQLTRAYLHSSRYLVKVYNFGTIHMHNSCISCKTAVTGEHTHSTHFTFTVDDQLLHIESNTDFLIEVGTRLQTSWTYYNSHF